MQSIQEQHTRWLRAYSCWALAAFAALALYVISRAREPFWDELTYLDRAKSLVTAPWFGEWLVRSESVAAGPSHALMHFGLAGGAGVLTVPWVRLPNLVLLASTLLGLCFCAERCGSQKSAGLSVLAVPMTWVVCGLALSEPLGFAGITLALTGAILWRTRGNSPRAAVGGLACLAIGTLIATTTRQNYVAAVPGLLLTAASDRREWIAPTCAVAVGLLPVAALVAVWHGLIPPGQAHVARGLSPVNGFLTFAIAGVVAVILAPRLFLAHRWIATISGAGALVANELFSFVRPTTLTSAQRFFAYPEVARVVERMAGALLVACGGAFAATAVAVLLKTRSSIVTGTMVATLCMCGSAAAITHQFSSRYPVMALPFLVVALAPSMTFGPWALGRAILGSLIGLLALHSYYVFA